MSEANHHKVIASQERNHRNLMAPRMPILAAHLREAPHVSSSDGTADTGPLHLGPYCNPAAVSGAGRLPSPTPPFLTLKMRASSSLPGLLGQRGQKTLESCGRTGIVESEHRCQLSWKEELGHQEILLLCY